MTAPTPTLAGLAAQAVHHSHSTMVGASFSLPGGSSLPKTRRAPFGNTERLALDCRLAHHGETPDGTSDDHYRGGCAPQVRPQEDTR